MEKQPDTYIWKIVEIREETPNVKTLFLRAEDARPEFIHGQYLTVRLSGFEPAEGKSYSISSGPQSEYVALTIKEMGSFSKALLAHHVGDVLTTSAPYGFFYPELEENRDLAFVVGGIGITPAMSIIESLSGNTFKENIFLFYSNRTKNDIVFKDRLDELKAQNKQLHVTHFITRENSLDEEITIGRMTADSVLGGLKRPPETDFFICGSIDFTKNVWKMLKDAGIESSQLYTEGFF